MNRLICAREYKLSARFGTLSNHDNIYNKFSNANIMYNNIKSLLIGCLLGDAHIGKFEKDKAFITFEQTIKHKEYIMSIYKKLKGNYINLYDIKYYTREDFRYKSINNYIYFRTYNLEVLKPFADMFLSEDNKKIVPLDIEYHLDQIVLAYWISDDGQLDKNGGITLCTDKYKLDEVNHLIKALVNIFNIKCTIQYKKSKTDRIYYRIYISKSSLDKIKPIIIPYIHESFLYKLHI